MKASSDVAAATSIAFSVDRAAMTCAVLCQHYANVSEPREQCSEDSLAVLGSDRGVDHAYFAIVAVYFASRPLLHTWIHAMKKAD